MFRREALCARPSAIASPPLSVISFAPRLFRCPQCNNAPGAVGISRGCTVDCLSSRFIYHSTKISWNAPCTNPLADSCPSRARSVTRIDVQRHDGIIKILWRQSFSTTRCFPDDTHSSTNRRNFIYIFWGSQCKGNRARTLDPWLHSLCGVQVISHTCSCSRRPSMSI